MVMYLLPVDGGCHRGLEVSSVRSFWFPDGSKVPQAYRWGVMSNSGPRSQDLTAFCS